MIREWSISRFKSVSSAATLAFRPLTVLAGPNSSGKSSVIQSILLVAQSLGSRVPGRQLVLNGEHVRLGTFEDVLSQQSDEPSIEFGFVVDLPIGERSAPLATRSRDPFFGVFLSPPTVAAASITVTANLTFTPAGTGTDAASSTMHAEVEKASFRTSVRGQQAQLFATDEEDASQPGVSIERRSDAQLEQVVSGIANGTTPGMRQALRYSLHLSPRAKASLRRGRADLQFQEAPGEIVAARMQHFLPSTVIWKQHALQQALTSTLRRLSTLSNEQLEAALSRFEESTDAPRAAIAAAVRQVAAEKEIPITQFVRSLRGVRQDPELLRELLQRTQALAGDSAAEAMVAVEGPLPEEYAFAFEGVHGLFEDIRYLGPLRDDPKPLYSMSGAVDPTDVGSKGQYTAAVLDINAQTEIDFIAPGSSEVTKGRLSEAIQIWLQHFQMADAVRTSDEPKLGHRLLVRPTGIRTYVDLTNVGVGVSQVLPILVMALVSSPGSILLFEQPELHLHPAVQSQLGDFFISIARTGRQCIVETHSEYLINRLRLRIAESDDTSVMDLAMVHFIERPQSATHFTAVTINEYGAIPDWPRGFFDQGPNEAELILRSAMIKKNRRRQSDSTK